jgi:iron complex outermembrane receptor protein
MLLGFALAALAHAAAAQGTKPLLDTITVVASRTSLGETSRNVEVISRDEITHSSARTVADLLATRMSVDVYGRSAAQADISLRGSTAEQTLILVDGVRVSDAQSAHYALDLAVPLDAIERVEILRGSASALYGPDAIGGVINIITRHSATPTEVTTRGGGFGTFGGSASGGTTIGSVTVTPSAEYEKSDGFRAGTDYRDGSARIGLSSAAGAGQLDAHLGVGVRDFGANDFYGPYNSTERTGTTTADARWTVPAGDWSLTTTGSTRHHTDRFTLVRDDPAFYENLHDAWQSTGELVARGTLGGASTAFGADGLNAQLTSNSLGSREEWRGALFGEASVGSPQSGALDLGVRGDQSSIYGGFFSPSISGSLPLTDGVRIRASAARGFRAPTWTERYYTDPVNQGNPNLNPERFWSGDLGVRFALPRAASLDVAGFARRAEDLIDWVRPAGSPATAVWQATNVGVATYRGVEATLALPRMSGVDYTLAATGLTFDDSQGAGLIGKYGLRPVTRQFVVRAALPELRAFRATFEIMHARRATEDGYVTGNARLEWRHDQLRITLDARNLTNAEWLDASAEPVAGRALYIGASWTER